MMNLTNKRKCDEVDQKAKGTRRRKRSRSEPLPQDPDMTEKRTALKRLFGRICSVELENQPIAEEEDFDDPNAADENEDPLLDSVPVNMDPEQLGFIVCAHLTLRFLESRGIQTNNPMFARLRTRLLQGIRELRFA